MTVQTETRQVVYRVGDTDELVRDVPGRRELAAGRRGLVVVGNDAGMAASWNMVSVVLGADPERGKAWLVRPSHVRLLARGGDDDPPVAS